jgi:hypothetical protein
MVVSEILKNQITEDNNYLILDSSPNSPHGDVNFEWYYYNTLRFNKMNPGDVFIYRRPAKSSKDRLFYFYGGGVIEHIEKIDAQGNVRARIINSFKFLSPLKQGDLKLENFDWKFKQRPSGSWERYFNQYGMNVITKYDFENLFGDLQCVPFQMLSSLTESQKEDEEEQEVIPTALNLDFLISVTNDQGATVSKGKKSKRNNIVNVKKADFNKQHEENLKLGKFGELQIVQFEIQNLIKNNRQDLAKQVEHSSDIHGDGLGYDIKSFEIDGTDKFIEVKTTRKNDVDGFYMSSNEINVSKEKSQNYFIYRLYNVSEKEGKADLYVYAGACNEEKFKLTPITYRVSLK